MPGLGDSSTAADSRCKGRVPLHLPPEGAALGGLMNTLLPLHSMQVIQKGVSRLHSTERARWHAAPGMLKDESSFGSSVL